MIVACTVIMILSQIEKNAGLMAGDLIKKIKGNKHVVRNFECA